MLYQTCQRCHTNVTATADVCLPCEADHGRALYAGRLRIECVMCGKRIPSTSRSGFVCSDQCQVAYDQSMADQLETEDGLIH